MIFHIERAFQFLPRLRENEAFLALVIFRRKWLVKAFPEREEEFRRLFKGSQILIGKEVLHSNKRLMLNRVKRLLSQFTSPMYSKEILVKGRVFDAYELWKRSPFGFSLMVTFEPRDVLSATKSFLADFTEKMLFENYDLSEVLNFDKEWQNRIQKSSRRGERSVLVDCETPESFREVLSRARKFEEAVRYCVQTPSGGAHLIFQITDDTRDFFSERRSS